jgi:hypothetical protein
MNPPQSLATILQFNISLAPWMIWAMFGLFLLGYAVMSGILFYHWIVYGMKSKGILFAQFIFPLGSAFLIYMAFFTLSNL